MDEMKGQSEEEERKARSWLWIQITSRALGIAAGNTLGLVILLQRKYML